MAAARLSTIFILILYLQDSFGQQLNFCNKPNLRLNNLQIGCPHQALQRKANLISNPQTFNQIPTAGNHGSSFMTQQTNRCGQINLQPLNYQQSANVQQPVNLMNQQPLVNQNGQQSLNLQSTSTPLNLQMIGQQVPQSAAEVSLASMPVVNGQLSGLPTQISQGVLLSNLGLTSSLPTLLPNICGTGQSIDSIPNGPITQTTNFPLSISAGVPSNVALSNESPIIQYQNPSQSNLQIFDLATIQGHLNQNQVILNSMQPQQIMQTQIGSNQLQTGTVPNQQTVQPQPIIASIQTQPMVATVQNQPTTQSQPVVAMVQTQPVANAQTHPAPTPVQNQPTLITSYLLSQTPSPSQQLSDLVSNSFSNSQSTNQESKSSNIKSLLPLLFNLLKEKNCCGCRSNQNCGCANNNNSNPLQPQVFSGYSNHINYGPSKEYVQANSVDSEECDENLRRRQYHKNKDDSADIDEDNNEYEEDLYDDDEEDNM